MGSDLVVGHESESYPRATHPTMIKRIRTLILGAAGRDFHNFNVVYRDDPATEVVAFTATQIPGIAGRRYPPSLAGSLYPDGIPIIDETELDTLVRGYGVQRVVFSYSDVLHEHVMHLASRALAAGSDFVLLGPDRTMLRALVPVIAVSAVRTGCGKSQTARYLAHRLRAHGLSVAVVRHPMPYGDLERQALQRFATRADLDAAGCTIEEREEYEPHIDAGHVVYAGVDYRRIIGLAEQEADMVLWDGGNNDFPFVRPDLHVVLVDALRPTQVDTHHPGEAVLRMADIVVVTKTDTASAAQAAEAVQRVRAINPRAPIVRAASPVTLDDPEAVRGKRVLVIEDGPTLIHGDMPWGAGYIAAKAAGAESIVQVLPAKGYSTSERIELARAIEDSPADIVVSGTPHDLAALLKLTKPVVRARYEFRDVDEPGLWTAVERFLRGRGL
jgi:predicted GTPase